MLNSLYVKNFRNLKELTISSLGRVNLIAGKNNTGKTSLLEAIALYASKGDMAFIYEFLIDRGEISEIRRNVKDFTEENIRLLSSIFFNRRVDFSKGSEIVIGELSNAVKETNNLSIRFVEYIEEVSDSDIVDFIPIKVKIVLDDNKKMGKHYDNIKLGLEIKFNKESFIFPLLNEILRNRRLSFFGEGYKAVKFVRAQNINGKTNKILWEEIALTEKEQYVINALQIIEPNIERIAFVDRGYVENTPIIKLSTDSDVLPLRSMGDGINRILTIILALVNADNGYLLIDEFENGLHYSIQEKLWEIIFTLSEKLNIQVFATTHSFDCIRAFTNVLNKYHEINTGKLIRLDNINGTIRQVDFDKNELKIAIEQNIEIR